MAREVRQLKTEIFVLNEMVGSDATCQTVASTGLRYLIDGAHAFLPPSVICMLSVEALTRTSNYYMFLIISVNAKRLLPNREVA